MPRRQFYNTATTQPFGRNIVGHSRIKVTANIHRPFIKITRSNSAVYIDTVGIDRHQLSLQSITTLITIAGIFYLLVSCSFYQTILEILDLVKAPVTITPRTTTRFIVKTENFTISPALTLSIIIKAPVQVNPQITILLLTVTVIVIAIPPFVKGLFT